MSEVNVEEILIENPERFTVFPIQYSDIYELYKTHLKLFWVVEEVDLTSDLAHWKKLSDDERHFIKHVLAFFAASDGIVMENLSSRFSNEVQITEARLFYGIQNTIEGIHGEMYSLLIETYINDKKEKDALFNAIKHFPSIAQKADWALKWISSQESFAIRLVAFAIVEGVFFSGSFACIYWLQERGIMPGLCSSNALIARDEGMHVQFAVTLYNKLKFTRLDQSKIEEIFREAVKLEKNFIIEALPCALLGVNSDSMSQYIEFVADRLIKQLGYTEIFGIKKCPLPFMERICLEQVNNFFEGRTTEYQRNFSKCELTFDDDYN